MGANAKGQPRSRTGKDAADGSAGSPGNTGSVVDAAQQGAPAEPTPGPANPPQPEATVRVRGQLVTEFRALIDGQAAALVTQERTAVFNRVYFTAGQFNLGDGQGTKVAGETITGCDYDPEHGLQLHTTNYEVFIPTQAMKVTWRR